MAKKKSAAKKTAGRKRAAKRGLVDTGRRKRAKTTVKRGQGDKGDR